MGTRLRWYQVVYRLAYRLGLTIWQRPKPPAELVALTEGPTPLAPGRALDLGCGTGVDTVYLASHGWEVTGVDMVPKALTTARRHATAAGVSPRFLQGDVTRLRDVGVGAGYTLVLDFGCFHTLPDDQRDAYVTSVTEVAASDAMLLLYGFTQPPKAAPMHAGVRTEEIQRRFGAAGWRLLRAERTPAGSVGISVPRADERFELCSYRLQRTTTV